MIALREELGPDNGADMIRAALLVEAAEQDWASQGLVVPARSTINAILDRAGLLTKTPRKRPRLNRPGVSGDFEPWEGWSYARRHAQAVPV